MPICNKEDDNAARLGKVLVGISGFGIFMALIGIVVAFVTLAGWSAPEGDYSGCTDALKIKFGNDPCESVNCDSAGGGSVDPWGPSGGSDSGPQGDFSDAEKRLPDESMVKIQLK